MPRFSIILIPLFFRASPLIRKPGHQWLARRAAGKIDQALVGMKRQFSIFALAWIPVVLSAQSDTPAWLWTENDTGETVSFRHEFGLDYVPEDYTLTVTADFADLEVVVNGETVERIEAYDPVVELPVADFLLPESANEIELIARPVAGPSAVAAEMRFTRREGDEIRLVTGKGDWEGPDVIEKGRVLPARWELNELPEVPPSAEYNQWKEALEDSAVQNVSPLPDGFSLTTVRAAQKDEDSWVSLAIDPQGRLVVGKERKGLLRFTLSQDGERVEKAETINDTLEECRGLAFRGATLYANANRSKALHRLRDTTGDDLYDEIVEIQSTEGTTGHGRNDLALGPEGTIHAIHGDSVEAPDNSTFFTAPEPGDPKPLGYWSSIGENEDEWNLYNRGLRNPYGIDFHRDGDPFTYDADNEGDLGLPFYRPTRINHLVAGANYGWHQRPGNTRSLPVYAPDSVPTTYDVGRGSPTAVKFGYRSNFPEPWRSALFALDWAYGRIVAVHLVSRGASYYASGEVFLEGRPLNVTDLDFDDSGTMYFVTGGRKTRSALFRLSYEGSTESPRPSPDLSRQAQDRESFSAEARESRRRLESGTGPLPDDSECWSLLGSPDPWLRNAARVRLERRPVEEWREKALGHDADLGWLTALLALVRQGSDTDSAAALETAAAHPTEAWRRTEKLSLLRIGELGLSPDTPEPVRDELAARALAWIGNPAAPVTREAVRLLALLDAPEAVETARRFLSLSQTQEDRLHYLEMLSLVRSGWTRETRTAYFKELAAARRTSRGDRFMPPFFDELEASALASAPEDAREEMGDLLAPAASEEDIPPPRPFVKNWTLSDFSDEDFEAAESVSPETGRELFRAGLCHRCHTFGADGHPVGPDLDRVGSRFSPRDLLQSILEPSAVVAEVYRNTTATLEDGTTLTGRLLRDDFRESTLHLSTNPFAPTEMTQVPKDRIASLSESGVSPMPPSLLAGFQKEEVVALVRWLSEGPGTSEK
ncbi:MAG: hypothetical protein WD342_12145 [Verrucomicrobiales bacterium]